MEHPYESPEISAAPQRRSDPHESLTQPADRKNDRLIPVDLAIQKGMRLRLPIEVETVDLQDASGRVLAQPLTAPTPLPRFDHSAMDGYAVNVDDLNGFLPVRLTVIGRVAASRTEKEIAVQAGTAIRILTGAPIPPGANTVIAQEEIKREGDTIVISRLPQRGENIRLRGEDVQAGATLITRGSLMDPRAMGVTASAGLAKIEVFRKLRVAIFSTGSELRQPGETIALGEIYNSNRYILRGLLDKAWISVVDLGSCHDDPKALSARMRDAIANADVVITTGGVSVGDEDHMADVVRQCEGAIVVSGVAIKPGKPLTLGRVGQAAYIGLPGNPGAVFTTFCAVVEGLLGTWAGLRQPIEPASPAIANFVWPSHPGRSTYLPAILTGYSANGAPIVDLLPKANSGKLALLSRAEGFVVIGPHRADIKRGDAVEWFPLTKH
ncbi:molybdopterin molybdotransferase MoeA [Afipia felis]|uniref:Molybdopterin molybdenumtransferase n=2 Tax=Afipia felis TaxID=1035 RepID=A0A380W5D6_AFIFE|nr:gephyrin-like molybdotransferase Glp [Afipia felis]EKS30988.1 molybdenum cofactor synthesis domain-containing protein [Afipia felis ATCC 53690]SUU75732.1 Molybdopterin molybdenumtransferase [Afipia felis]SUU83799.1 Molybdopterin molybdenumtransferase [Afipia felis]